MAERGQHAPPLFGDGLVALDGWLFAAELAVEARDQAPAAEGEDIGVEGGFVRGAPTGDPSKCGDSIVSAGRVFAEVDLDPLDN